jgi:hypothetical protein
MSDLREFGMSVLPDGMRLNLVDMGVSTDEVKKVIQNLSVLKSAYKKYKKDRKGIG